MIERKKIKVLYINHETRGEGGSTASLINLIHSVEKEVKPIVLVRSKENLVNFKKAGIKCFYYPFSQNVADTNRIRGTINYLPRMFRDYFLDKKCVKKVTYLLREENIEIVHSNSSVIGVGLEIARKLQAKSIIHLREFLDLDFKTKPFWGWKSVKRIIMRSDYVIAITQAIYNHWNVATLNTKSSVMWNAVRKAKTILPVIHNKDKYVLFCASRATENKGVFDAVEIFCKSGLPQLGYSLRIVGRTENATRERILRIAKTFTSANQICFLGYVKEIDILMNKASAFLMCSKNEALGRVTIEAMFAGCPVLGRNSGGTKELIKHGVNGYLYNDINEGAKLLKDIVGYSETTTRLIEEGRSFAINNFSEEVYGNKIIAIYNQLVKQNLF